MPHINLVRPEEPFQQTLEYYTDVQTSWNGNELRVPTRGTRPRHSFVSNYLLDREDELSRESLFILQDTLEEIYQPLWHEEKTMNTVLATGHTTIFGDYQETLSVGMEVLILEADELTYEIGTVKSVNPGFMRLEEAITTPFFSSQATVIPLIRTKIFRNNPRFSHHPAGLSDLTINTTSTDSPIMPEGVPFPLYKHTPIVRTPVIISQDTIDDEYEHFRETDDWGLNGAFFSLSSTPLSRRVRAAQFRAKGTVEMGQWKNLFNRMMGSVGSIYVPTFLNDLRIIYNGTGGITLNINNNPNIVSKFRNEQDLIIRYNGGMLTRYADIIRDNMDGTASIQLNTRLPDPFPQSGVTIGFLDRCRLRDNTIEMLHYSDRSVITMVLTTIISDKEVREPVPEDDIGEFSDDFNEDYTI